MFNSTIVSGESLVPLISSWVSFCNVGNVVEAQSVEAATFPWLRRSGMPVVGVEAEPPVGVTPLPIFASVIFDPIFNRP